MIHLIIFIRVLNEIKNRFLKEKKRLLSIKSINSKAEIIQIYFRHNLLLTNSEKDERTILIVRDSLNIFGTILKQKTLLGSKQHIGCFI